MPEIYSKWGRDQKKKKQSQPSFKFSGAINYNAEMRLLYKKKKIIIIIILCRKKSNVPQKGYFFPGQQFL